MKEGRKCRFFEDFEAGNVFEPPWDAASPPPTTSGSPSLRRSPFNWDGQKTLGKDDFSKIPNGGPGIGNRLHMFHHFGVREGRISMSRFVELVSTAPAKFFGMYPRKGIIAAGSDADIVVFDPEKHHTISARTHHSNIDYNLYEGTEVVGAPDTVLVRDKVIVENDQLVGSRGDGRFVRRARFGENLTATESGAGGR